MIGAVGQMGGLKGQFSESLSGRANGDGKEAFHGRSIFGVS